MTQNAMQSLIAGSLTAALAAPAVAQDPAAPDTLTQPATRSVMARSFGMGFVAGALRAGGPGYKARFDRDGMQYTPALGDAAPRNLPVRIRLESIRRGQHVLFEAAAGNAVAPRQQGMIASYDRGDGVVETYEARVDGVKQNFTFQTVPMGSGDLVVMCELQTELQSVRGTSDQGFSLEMPGVGGVTIGQVLGVDAFGNRAPGSMSCDGATLQLVLPDDFVTHAAYPMVLDPIIGTATVANSDPAKDPDVAFDETYDHFLVVWEHQFSQLDIDIRGQKFGFNGNLVSSMLPVSNAADLQRNVSVGNVDAGDAFLVCWQDGATAFGPWHLRARRVEGDASNSMSPAPVDITAVGGGARDPDVSGDNTSPSGTYDGCIVAYADGAGVKAVKVDVSTMSVTAGPVTITSNALAGHPAISKSGGAAGRHAIVYQRQNPTNRDVLGALVDRDLTVLDPQFSVETVAGLDSFHPDIDGDGDSWLVVFQQNESGSLPPADIWCRRFAWNGNSVSAAAPATPVAAEFAKDEREPAIGFLGTKYVVAWSIQTSILEFQVRMIELNATDCHACGAEQTAAGGVIGAVQLNAEVATRYSGRSSSEGDVNIDQGVVVWMNLTQNPPFDGDIVAHRYEAFGGGPVGNLSGACGNGGLHSVGGPCALGNAQFELRLSGAGSSINLASVMFADSSVPCGPCTIQSDPVSFLFAPGLAGNAVLPLPIPCDTTLIGAEVFTQWASLLTGSTPCLLLPPSLGISFSNRVKATIAP